MKIVQEKTVILMLYTTITDTGFLLNIPNADQVLQKRTGVLFRSPSGFAGMSKIGRTELIIGVSEAKYR